LIDFLPNYGPKKHPPGLTNQAGLGCVRQYKGRTTTSSTTILGNQCILYTGRGSSLSISNTPFNIILEAASLIYKLKIYLVLFILAPIPRDPLPSEKTYITTTSTGDVTSPISLPCWHDAWAANRKKAEQAGRFFEPDNEEIEEAEVVMSVVVPAYNEEERLEGMLDEAIEYLDSEYGRPTVASTKARMNGHVMGAVATGNGSAAKKRPSKAADQVAGPRGYEVIIVSDGSKDKTVDVALRFSKKHQLHDVLRVVSLKENRGKGGAVTHGFRHVRGQYAIFADADGASTFSDIKKLVQGCQEVQDEPCRGIAVGSRAHMVNSDAVVKVKRHSDTPNPQEQKLTLPPFSSAPQSATP
jgi:dolichyl-phosphate beta-glucosyltransferase